MITFYWHDYETWGTDPSLDRPCQFAGVRTDQQLNILGEPLVIYCKPPLDILPHPEACLVTGITPQETLVRGVEENQFIASIHTEFSQPGTCGVGYNSIRFDDEVTRYTLYRNFYDPYEREWRNGNSRWDIIDMVRLTYALRPEGIEWPIIDGKPSFRLENLTEANGIGHTAAHDAYSDVAATIELAKLILSKQPQLYHYCFEHRLKAKVNALIDIKEKKPLLHISSMFPANHGCAALVAPLAMHPINRNAVIAFNLSSDPQPLADLSVDDIRQRLFTAQEDLPEGIERIPLKLIHMNKSPALVTPKLLDNGKAKRLNIDKAACERNWHKLLQLDIVKKVQDIYLDNVFEPRVDPERCLYDGFLNDRDKRLLVDVRRASASILASQTFSFEDSRLPELLFRYRARNFPDSLSRDEQQQWFEFCRTRLSGGDNSLSLTDYYQRIADLIAENKQNDKSLDILQQLKEYGQEIEKQIDI